MIRGGDDSVTKKQLLDRLWEYDQCKKRLAELQDRLDDCRAAGTRITSIIGSVKGGSVPDKVGEAAARAADIASQMERERKVLADAIDFLLDVARMLPDEEGNVLLYRHLRGLDWKEICKAMEMSRTQAWKIYSQAIGRLDSLLTGE